MQPTRDIYVVTFTKKQFDILIDEGQRAWDFELKHRLVHYVESPEQLRNIPPARVFLFGSYFKRTDWPLIQEAILAGRHMELKLR